MFDQAIRFCSKIRLRLQQPRDGLRYERGVGEGARRSYTIRAIRLNPKNDTAYYRRGNIFREQRKYDRAIADYTDAIHIRNPMFSGFSATAAFPIPQRRESRKKRRFADFNEAVRLDPKNVLAYINRGDAFRNKGNCRKPLPTSMRPSDSTRKKRHGLQQPRICLHDWRSGGEGGFADFNEVIRLDPKNAYAYSERGIIFFDSGRVRPGKSPNLPMPSASIRTQTRAFTTAVHAT